MVSEVSAILVAMMILRPSEGATAASWSCGRMSPCSGRTAKPARDGIFASSAAVRPIS